MTKTELKLAAHLLKMAADEFSYHTCNDLPKQILAIATEEEKAIIAKEFGKFNEHTETPKEEYKFDSLGDSALMSYLADKLEKLADGAMSEVKRLETGVVQVAGDWPGIFMRGDNAMADGFMLGQIAALLEKDVKLPGHLIKRLKHSGEFLRSCEAGKCEKVQAIKREAR